MANNGTQLLPGQSAPLETITPTDQSGIIVIATALGLIFASISLLIRLYLQIEIRRKIGRDDVAVLLAMLFAVAQASAVFVEVKNGFGKTLIDIPPANLPSLQQASYSSDILYIVSIWLTKCSVVFLTFRLSPDKRHNLASYGVLAASTLFVVISLFIIALGCNVSQPWLFINTQYGSNMFIRWQIVAAFDIITELALLGVSVFLVGALQLSLHKKFVVIFAFALRLPIIVAIAFRLYYLHAELLSLDPTLKGSIASVCTQIQLSYAIVATTTPCLRPFMTALNTHYGAPAEYNSPPGTKKSANSYVLSSLSKKSQKSRTLGEENGTQTTFPDVAPNTRWDGMKHQTSVIAGDSISLESHSSIQMIIQKNTEWDVEFDGASRVSTHPSPELI